MKTQVIAVQLANKFLQACSSLYVPETIIQGKCVHWYCAYL